MHGPEMVEELLRLTQDKDPRVRLGALQTALDRGYGKAVQHIEAELSVYDGLGLAEQQTLLAALEELDLVEGEPVNPIALPEPGNGTDD